MEVRKMEKKECLNNQSVQPTQYTTEELKKLKEFVETVKNDDTRSALACWGNHDNYNHGY